MTIGIVSVSQTELAQRRRKLRQRRRVRLVQTVWRILAVTGLAGGLVWAVTLPDWVITSPQQVKIEGNRFIPVSRIRSLLPITYPRSLWRVEPQKIAQELQSKMPLAEVVVNRQLFPPGLTVQLKERYPVAIAVPTAAGAQGAAPAASQATASSTGLLDENGFWIPLESYASLDQSLKMPALKVIGNQEQYRPFWTKLYREIRRSPVKISEIDWQDPANLILKTELGTVVIGAYSAQLSNQLAALDKMRQLPTHLNSSQVDYIDLRNPDVPTVQMNKSKDPVKSDTP